MWTEGCRSRCFFLFRGFYRYVGLVLSVARTLYSVLVRGDLGGIRIDSPSRLTHCIIGRNRAVEL